MVSARMSGDVDTVSYVDNVEVKTCQIGRNIMIRKIMLLDEIISRFVEN